VHSFGGAVLVAAAVILAVALIPASLLSFGWMLAIAAFVVAPWFATGYWLMREGASGGGVAVAVIAFLFGGLALFAALINLEAPYSDGYVLTGDLYLRKVPGPSAPAALGPLAAASSMAAALALLAVVIVPLEIVVERVREARTPRPAPRRQWATAVPAVPLRPTMPAPRGSISDVDRRRAMQQRMQDRLPDRPGTASPGADTPRAARPSTVPLEPQEPRHPRGSAASFRAFGFLAVAAAGAAAISLSGLI
jgi:hypothetical protein